MVEQRDGLGALTQIAYGAGETTLTDPRVHPTTYTFDSRLRVLTQRDVVGAATLTLSYAYDAQGNRTSVTDRAGRTTDFTYDARGNVLSKTDPSPGGIAPRPVTAFAYDARNNLTQITDALGAVTTLAYDSATNVLLAVSREIDATTAAVTRYEYADPANPGLPTRVIAPRGNTTPTPDHTFATALAYDAQGNLLSRTDPDGATTTFAYDAAGRLHSFVDPDGNAPGADTAEHTWTISYDPLDRETSRTDPLGNTIAYAYDGAGNRTSLADRSGNVTTYRYDANTRLAAVQQRPDPLGQPALVYTTAVARDPNGNAARITQANGVVTDYAFDGLDRLTQVTTYPSPTTPMVTSYTLDPSGQPLTRTTGDGVTVSYAYDALARLVSVTAPGLASISYAYDPLGRRTQMSDGTGTTTYAYDSLGRVTEIAAPGGTLGYAYDLDGNRTALRYPGGDTVQYAYSPGGRLAAVTDWAGRISTYSYQPSGLVSSLAYPNGMTAGYAYDRAQRLTAVANATAQKTISTHAYTLDSEGNRTALDEFVRGLTVPPLVVADAARVNDDPNVAAQDEPQLAIDPSGAAHLVWTDSRLSPDGAIFYARRDPATGTWSPNERVSGATDPGVRRSPALATDAVGNLYAVWQLDKPGESGVDTDIWSARRDAATGTWSQESKVGEAAQGLPGQKSPRIAVSATGAATALWLGYRNNRWEIVAADLAPSSATWSASVVLTDGPAALRAAPDLALAPDSSAYAVWQDERGGNTDIFFATRAPGATSWSANIRLDDDTGSAAQSAPRIAVDAQGNALAAWLDERSGTAQVRASRRLAGSATWSASEVVSDPAARPASLALAVRSDGHAAVVWEDARGATSVVFGAELSAIAGGTWSAPTQLADTIAADQRRPAVALRTDDELLNEVVVSWRDDRRAEGGDVFSLTRAGAGSGLDHIAYAYDGLSRLVSSAGGLAESWSFDAASNMTARTGPAASNRYDGANRLLSDGTRTFTWDGADRLVGRGADTFSYDALSRLTASTVASTTRTYAYDGDGMLRSRTEGATTTSLLWDPSVAPAPLLQSGSDRVVYGLGPLYLVRADDTTLALARDGLGSVRAEVTDSGAVARSFRYAAYGTLAASNGGSPALLGYAGELADPSGLIYLRMRWYDPLAARFMTRDPLAGNLGAPASFNSFGYGAGRPTSLVDPLGLEPWATVRGAAQSAAYAVAGVFADLDSDDTFRRVTAYGFVIVGGVAVAGAGIAAVGAAFPAVATMVDSGLATWVVHRAAAQAAAAAYVIGETQSLVSRAAQGIGGVTMPFIGNPALRERNDRAHDQ